jgi:NAD(P)-dependent dehydrogenase (short-subunit alcohol dehydrogenase family)
METGLKGKIAIITGAAQGIGRATAITFAKEGTHLGLLDIDEAGLAEVKAAAEQHGVTAATAKTDLSTEAGVKAGIDAVLAAHGGVADILVNNVCTGYIRTFDQLTDSEWEATLQLNFMSYVRSCRKLLPVLRERSGAAIINNASDLAAAEPVPIG